MIRDPQILIKETSVMSIRCRRAAGSRAQGFTAFRPCLSALAMLAALGTGCGSKDHEINAFIHDWEATATATDQIVAPPDVIEITSPTAPEIDGETHVVGSDGKISLRLVGQVKVAGLTPVEISRKIEGLLATYYVEPTVTVRMYRSASKKIFVFGEVARGGALPFTGRDTVLSVLSQAQPTFLAWKDQIKVIRPSHEDNKRHIITVDAYRLLEQGDLSLNVMLQEGDMVYVPPTPLAWLGLRVREVLFPVQPMAQTVITPGQTKLSYDALYDNGND